MNRLKRTIGLLAGAASTMMMFAACGNGGGQGADDDVLRIAMVSPGEAQIRVWKDIAKQYEKAHPGMKVQLNFQDDDLYQSVGLPSLLNGRKAPDIYFEWAGDRLATRVKDGFAADVGSYVGNGPLKGLIGDSAYNLMKVGGKTVMVPFASDVTNVLWYNTKVMSGAGVAPPKTWDELLAACDTLRSKGITPIAAGNKDLWPVGNWIAHLVSRVAGESSYAQVLSGKAGFDSPGWSDALGHVAQLRDHKCLNDTASALNDTEGDQMFLQGKAAMHPIGSWLVSASIEEAPKLEIDYVNLPSVPGSGDQNSVIGVATGYVINAKSKKIKESADFLALANSGANVTAFTKSGTVPQAKPAPGGPPVDPRTTRLNALLSGAKTLVLPPDTGYELKRAEAFYRAVSLVLGGKNKPQDALAAAARKAGTS
ncbi:ABC transporter substrate-binding protein [Actinomadura rubrisoli]|uniref:Extracellular solute-binding protein n=1 Tax=Actinomadura rubrisoli TaxID=2530368 RepID=A0A4V2YZ28_9ACTN|nr:extracellular solute-binding protein [Actinomadura rubrisoli]TDD95317.1 extracellular solute-binding protein [Actinomadura rubrisoli]